MPQETLTVPSLPFQDLPLEDQVGLLAHLSRCAGFLYFIGSLRSELADARAALERMPNTREQDVALKATISSLGLIESKFYDAVDEAQGRIAEMEEQEGEPDEVL